MDLRARGVLEAERVAALAQPDVERDRRAAPGAGMGQSPASRGPAAGTGPVARTRRAGVIAVDGAMDRANADRLRRSIGRSRRIDRGQPFEP